MSQDSMIKHSFPSAPRPKGKTLDIYNDLFGKNKKKKNNKKEKEYDNNQREENQDTNPGNSYRYR